MKIHGSLRANLLSAIASAHRLRGHPIHQDTIAHWRGLLELGRRNGAPYLGEPVADLVVQLEHELAAVAGR